MSKPRPLTAYCNCDAGPAAPLDAHNVLCDAVRISTWTRAERNRLPAPYQGRHRKAA